MFKIFEGFELNIIDCQPREVQAFKLRQSIAYEKQDIGINAVTTRDLQTTQSACKRMQSINSGRGYFPAAIENEGF